MSLSKRKRMKFNVQLKLLVFDQSRESSSMVIGEKVEYVGINAG